MPLITVNAVTKNLLQEHKQYKNNKAVERSKTLQVTVSFECNSTYQDDM